MKCLDGCRVAYYSYYKAQCQFHYMRLSITRQPLQTFEPIQHLTKMVRYISELHKKDNTLDAVSVFRPSVVQFLKPAKLVFV